MRKNLLIPLLICLLAMGAQAQLKPRVVILTDIGQPFHLRQADDII